MNGNGSSQEVPEAASPVEPGTSKWIVSPGFDIFWILSGLWLIALFRVSFAVGLEDWIVLAVGHTGVALALIHAWSTTWTVLGSPVFAKARSTRMTELYLIPGMLLLASVILGLLVVSGPSFEEGAGFGWEHTAFALYLTSFVLFHFFHFAQQDFGVLSLYRHRAKQFSSIDRKVDLYFSRFLIMGVMPLLNLKVFAESPFKVWVTSWLPVPVPVLNTMADVGFGLAILATAGALLFELRKPNTSMPKAAYIILMGLHPFTLWMTNFTAFSLVYVYSHWIIAIALAWRINRNHNIAAPNPRRAWAGYVIGFGTCVVVSTAIHYGLEEFSLFDNTAFRDHVGKAGPFMGLILGLVLGEQLTHYYYDRVLFKFSDPYVRENVGPLLN